MAPNWERLLQRWLDAALVDRVTAERIRSYEQEHSQTQGLRWPVLLTLVFGGLLLAAGVLLFVAAHWENLSPANRFSLVLTMVAVFHVAGAFTAERFRALSITLHGVGTVALGAGIFLSGQIFNLQEHWPGGVMLWAIGAWFGWWLSRDWIQFMLVGLLTPAWLAGEWNVATQDVSQGYRVLAEGALLLSITYLTARTQSKDSHVRRVLMWIGGLSIIPCVFMVLESWDSLQPQETITRSVLMIGWASALGLPLLVALMLRGYNAWMNAVAMLWVIGLGLVRTDNYTIWPYVLCALGAIALVCWGLAEERSERINLGTAGFALTVAFFYFSNVMDKLGRSASLIGLGVLFLAGGLALERIRRQLVAKVKRTSS